MKFRKDINGLRAFAVIAVVLFHFNASWMPGGFAGVDVFFVISGFLMTGIIFKGLENNNFSVLNFYIARANRIIPALAALCLALLVFGWFYLTPVEYRALGKHAASSVGFLSNIIYFTEAGYFDAASHEKWLLHTWSLSVEWQFYIIYPLVLLALKRIFSLKTLKSLIIVATVIGFLFSVYATYKWPSASYYLFPMRAWEMMLGGVAFLYPIKLQESNKRLVEILGLILIVASYIFITGDDPWPGYLALFPVLGTFLVIQAQRNESIITGNIIFQKLGAWSYSIYLWHWPFVVAIYTFSLPSHYIYIGMALSVLLGYLSYKYIERIKFPRSFPTLLGYLKCKPIYIAGIIGILGSIIFLKYEFFTPYRLTPDQIKIVSIKSKPRPSGCGVSVNGAVPDCQYGSGPVKAIVIGDSHSLSHGTSISEKAEKHGGSILHWGLAACPTIEHNKRIRGYIHANNKVCGTMVHNAINIAATRYPNTPIIVINRLAWYIEGKNEVDELKTSSPEFIVDKSFKERSPEYKRNLMHHISQTMCKLSQSNPVFLVRPTPEMGVGVPKAMYNSLTLNKTPMRVSITLQEYLERQELALKVQDSVSEKCGVTLLDPLPFFCDESNCYGDRQGIPLYNDDNHLNSYGAKTIASIFDEVFK